jgi:hypothetical protein
MAAVFWGGDRYVTTRTVGSFKDGTFIRKVEITKNKNGNQCRMVIASVEGAELYAVDLETLDGRFANFFIASIGVELSSFDGTVCLVLGGFDSGSATGTSVVVKLDYKAQPEVVWRQAALPGL